MGVGIRLRHSHYLSAHPVLTPMRQSRMTDTGARSLRCKRHSSSLLDSLRYPQNRTPAPIQVTTATVPPAAPVIPRIRTSAATFQVSSCPLTLWTRLYGRALTTEGRSRRQLLLSDQVVTRDTEQGRPGLRRLLALIYRTEGFSLLMLGFAAGRKNLGCVTRMHHLIDANGCGLSPLGMQGLMTTQPPAN